MGAQATLLKRKKTVAWHMAHLVKQDQPSEWPVASQGQEVGTEPPAPRASSTCNKQGLHPGHSFQSAGLF